MIKIVCDGVVCVNAPLGDFFATVPGPNDMHSYPITVLKDGTMVCYWPMPFKKKIEISAQPPSGLSVPMQVVATYSERPFTDTSYYFHAHWNTDIGSTRSDAGHGVPQRHGRGASGWGLTSTSPTRLATGGARATRRSGWTTNRSRAPSARQRRLLRLRLVLRQPVRPALSRAGPLRRAGDVRACRRPPLADLRTRSPSPNRSSSI